MSRGTQMRRGGALICSDLGRIPEVGGEAEAVSGSLGLGRTAGRRELEELHFGEGSFTAFEGGSLVFASNGTDHDLHVRNCFRDLGGHGNGSGGLGIRAFRTVALIKG